MTERFLLEASLLYEDRCPEVSRFLLQQHLENNVTKKSRHPGGLFPHTMSCQHCHQWLRPDNHHVRLRPKPRPSARVQSVLRRQGRGKRLSVAQRRLLLSFQKSSSVLMATCHTCNKTSRHKGMNRDLIATFARSHSTPGSSGKHKTPQSRANTPKTPGKDKTPAHTPRSSTSSGTPGSGSSSKPPTKEKNWVVQRLSKILMREDNQGTKKGGLKDFLSSL